MLKDKLIELINNDNHYTIPKYVLSYSKELELDKDSLILLIYFINQKNKDIFDYKKIIEDLNFSEKELLNAIEALKNKKLLSIIMEKNDSGMLEEKIDISSFYEIIFSKMLDQKETSNNKNNLYDVFEREFGRTLSPMEYEIINSWTDAGINEDLIIAALKETIFNGVNNLRYIDKILFEWNKKGIKRVEDIEKKEKQKEDESSEDCYEYDWLNE